ncbi:hypothetical protein H696_03042 [Fonticula alba]|uniref:U-box domain-containing protein n=1 Tax=Fonticula alba TaxID=691883 RepID=A0A058Z9T1_FONAL|nr:hypothetical protein H696_03042 [Fonticula alba]KCV70688.1 hypothetical protein H696_03042 [Fonticula alba]|eukprot:XP_009495204.1 hypothetical protein H696_03042 [Fonticula alba]
MSNVMPPPQGQPGAFSPHDLAVAAAAALPVSASPSMDAVDSQNLICPITQEIMTDPVVALDGHTYERSAIQTWFATSGLVQPPAGGSADGEDPAPKAVISPFTREKLASPSLVPNLRLRTIIREANEGSQPPSRSSSRPSSRAGSRSGSMTALHTMALRNSAQQAGHDFPVPGARSESLLSRGPSFGGPVIGGLGHACPCCDGSGQATSWAHAGPVHMARPLGALGETQLMPRVFELLRCSRFFDEYLRQRSSLEETLILVSGAAVERLLERSRSRGKLGSGDTFYDAASSLEQMSVSGTGMSRPLAGGASVSEQHVGYSSPFGGGGAFMALGQRSSSASAMGAESGLQGSASGFSVPSAYRLWSDDPADDGVALLPRHLDDDEHRLRLGHAFLNRDKLAHAERVFGHAAIRALQDAQAQGWVSSAAAYRARLWQGVCLLLSHEVKQAHAALTLAERLIDLLSPGTVALAVPDSESDSDEEDFDSEQDDHHPDAMLQASRSESGLHLGGAGHAVDLDMMDLDDAQAVPVRLASGGPDAPVTTSTSGPASHQVLGRILVNNRSGQTPPAAVPRRSAAPGGRQRPLSLSSVDTAASGSSPLARDGLTGTGGRQQHTHTSARRRTSRSSIQRSGPLAADASFIRGLLSSLENDKVRAVGHLTAALKRDARARERSSIVMGQPHLDPVGGVASTAASADPSVSGVTSAAAPAAAQQPAPVASKATPSARAAASGTPGGGIAPGAKTPASGAPKHAHPSASGATSRPAKQPAEGVSGAEAGFASAPPAPPTTGTAQLHSYLDWMEIEQRAAEDHRALGTAAVASLQQQQVAPASSSAGSSTSSLRSPRMLHLQGSGSSGSHMAAVPAGAGGPQSPRAGGITGGDPLLANGDWQRMGPPVDYATEHAAWYHHFRSVETADDRAAVDDIMDCLQLGYGRRHVALGNLAWTLFNLERYEEALFYSNESLALCNQRVATIETKASILKKLDRRAESLECWTAILERQPGRADAYVTRASLWDEPDKGIADCLAALRLSPGYPYARAMLAALYLDNGRLDKAYEIVENMPESELSRAGRLMHTVHRIRAHARAFHGDLAGSLRDFALLADAGEVAPESYDAVREALNSVRSFEERLDRGTATPLAAAPAVRRLIREIRRANPDDLKEEAWLTTTLERIGVAAHPLPGGYAPPALSTGDDVASFVYLYHLARRPVLNVEHVALTASRALAYYEHEVQTNEDLREITHLWKFLVHM